MIASNEVLKNKCVSLAGFSLGCKVIFNALKTMKDLAIKVPILRTKIANVIFMAGAQSVKHTEIWK